MLEQNLDSHAKKENFPVASWLVEARHRGTVMAFYRFVRAADNVADDPVLDPETKHQRLNAFERSLILAERNDVAPDIAKLAAPVLRDEVGIAHALTMLSAFRQDVDQRRYADWDGLMSYCRRSAAPVGRFLLDVHGEDPALARLSDPLCAALQVLNHTQDCGADFQALDRVYLATDAFERFGIAVDELAEPRCSPELRTILDETLDKTAALLEEAKGLAVAMGNRRMALETAVVDAWAWALLAKLRVEDPLAGRVRVSRKERAVGAVQAVGSTFWRRLAGARSPAGAGGHGLFAKPSGENH
ncbi:MAG: squalene synthase HpnC [Geminicoccaceae bacterium]